MWGIFLRNKLLTVRVRPRENELLSSFLIRMANANGLDVLKFCSSFSKKSLYYLQKDDIDLLDFYPLNILDIDKLAEISNIEGTLLLNNTFIKITEKFSKNNNSRVRNMTDLIRKQLFYCSECLNEGDYYRDIWKLEGVNGCLKHNKILLDKCMNCNEEILYKDINTMGKCPKCDFLLKRSLNIDIDGEEINKNIILSWMFLLECSSVRIENSELALKLLFLLNEFKNVLDRDLITKNLNKHTKLPTLLQHVRGTITNYKNLHLKIVLNILTERNINLKQLLSIVVPETFKKELRICKKFDSVFCKAPWCSSFKISGSLIKTGTSKKKKKDNIKMKYYLFCKECGCEYALDYNDQIIERTYFISAYNLLGRQNLNIFSLKKVSSILDLTNEKARRVIAYFTSREVSFNLNGITIESNKLSKFINGIREGQKIKQISKWEIWISYREFLVYRYHIDVINELFNNQRERKKDIGNSVIKSSNFLRVKTTVDDMLNNDEDISIKNVCNKLKVVPETLRNWGCNNYIAQVKQNQRSFRINSMREDVKYKLDLYLKNTSTEQISARSFYQYINIGRTVLWRIDKELTRYIAYKLGTLKEKDIKLV